MNMGKMVMSPVALLRKSVVCTVVLIAGGACVQTFAAERSATLTTTVTTKYQHIDGFGGTAMNGQWADVYTQQKVNMLWGTGEGQVGLNIMRIRINPNENSWGEYGNPIKWARQVNPALQVFATPWTPPKKYKTHNTTKYQNDYGTWVWPLVEHSWGGEGSNGGAINPAYYEAYADFLECYRAKMEEKGCPIDIISIQNESDYTPTATDNGVEHASYESCIYSPKEMAAMCKALRQRLDPKCKVMGPECFGWGQHSYNNTLVNIQDAVNNIDIWGNHLYGTNDWSFVQNVTKKTGRHMWETEFLLNYDEENAPGYKGEFKPEYKMIESIEQAMKAGYSAYVYYSMTNDFFACNHGGSDTQLWKRAWVFSHYAKYATGKTRIYSSLSTTVLKGGSAYVSEQGDSVVVMVLNTSAADTYNLTVKLPFEPARITQVATGDIANARRSDVTAKYANGTKNPVVKLLPGVFYTFVFEKTAAIEELPMATSPKQPSYANPLWANRFMADPTSIEYDGRLYVYATNDQQEFDSCDGMSTNSYGHITQLVCISTADLVNWTMHDVIDVKAAAPWIWASWAPSIISRKEADGTTRFYLYFTNGGGGIGVLTATSPTGPWTDPLGHAIIDGQTPGLGTFSNLIDPGAAINTDGTEAYLTFGGGDVTGTELQPGNARIVKLGADLISLDGDIKPISAPCHFEANELNYVGSQWVYSYCTRWTIPSNWSAAYTAVAPGAASIVYMTASDPLADNWKYKGTLMPNPGTLGYPYGNNHTHLQRFANKWYLLYHTQWLEQHTGISGGYRNLQIGGPLSVNTRSMTISALTAQTATVEGVAPVANVTVNPFDEQSGAMAAVATDNWWMVRNVNFSADNKTAHSLKVKVKGMGRLEVRRASLSSQPLAVVMFDAPDEQTITVPVEDEPTGLCDYLYFSLPLSADAQILSWQFSTDAVIDAIAPVSLSVDRGVAVYDLKGCRVGTSTQSDVVDPSARLMPGIYIIGGKKVVVK